MECKLHRLTALILSVVAHVALTLTSGISGDGQWSARSNQWTSSHVLTVQLRKPDDTASLPAPASIEHARHDQKTDDGLIDLSLVPRQLVEDKSILPTLVQPEPHYFQSKELTEKPHVLVDIPPNLTMTSPDVPTQSVVLRLMINEYGDIDQVKIEESQLPDDVGHLLSDAFSKTKFSPGRIGDMAVKSQLKIEVLLEKIAPETPFSKDR